MGTTLEKYLRISKGPASLFKVYEDFNALYCPAGGAVKPDCIVNPGMMTRPGQHKSAALERFDNSENGQFEGDNDCGLLSASDNDLLYDQKP